MQLRNGKEKVLEKSDPVALAEEFAKLSPVAVIDLDAAMGNGENEQLIRKICTLADCRVGGGIRSIAKAKKIFSYGAVPVFLLQAKRKKLWRIEKLLFYFSLLDTLGYHLLDQLRIRFLVQLLSDNLFRDLSHQSCHLITDA